MMNAEATYYFKEKMNDGFLSKPSLAYRLRFREDYCVEQVSSQISIVLSLWFFIGLNVGLLCKKLILCKRSLLIRLSGNGLLI